MTFPLLEPTELEIGSIGLRGRVPINPNCASASGRGSKCFYDIETADFELKVSGAIPGTMVAAPAQALTTWYTNLRFMLLNPECQDAYDKHFDCDECRQLSGFQAQTDCREKCTDLNRAKEWRRSQNSGGAGGALGLDPLNAACSMVESDSGEVMTYEPSAKILEELDEYDAEKAACDKLQQTEFIKAFDDSQKDEDGAAWSLDTQMAAAVVANTGQGALGKFNIICIEDLVHLIMTVGPHFKEANNFLWPFQLSSPRGGYSKKRLHYIEGGEAGNREEIGRAHV